MRLGSVLKKVNTFAIIAGITMFSGLSEASVKFPECVSKEGKVVKVFSVTEEFLRVQTGTQLAISMMGNYAVPIIAIDSKSLEKTPEQFQNFVFHHECAHHRLGHVTLRSHIMEKITGKKRLNRENEADCESITYLYRNLNYDSKDIQVITDTMVKQFASSSPVDRNGNRIRKGQFKYYTPIKERNKLMQKCFENLEVQQAH